jgi:hypothetical protein
MKTAWCNFRNENTGQYLSLLYTNIVRFFQIALFAHKTHRDHAPLHCDEAIRCLYRLILYRYPFFLAPLQNRYLAPVSRA